ncbi:leucine-rich repeat domain-containing protein [Corallococcus aberystwythensis]|uniref:Leucine-rich repeat domain-containing protein n=1 Tax=Corallococcus aberystwythensis TaxID=2316722 RepID=A0A3A8QST1_9BACT|nr:leucine-rich repeat domain-containing protein [Corallococcus aberystwythensis]RKH69405.1 hypothetical protein D7W81_11075 [Corallococcus aberystwythensis]
MPINPSDPGVSTALAQALGHPGPFSEAECAALEGPLVLLHARDVSDLRHCTGLKHLDLIACDVRSLGPLTALTALRQLTILATPIEDLAPLRELPTLAFLTLNFTYVTDALPLVGLPALARAELLGNPWTEESYTIVAQRIASTSSARLGTPPLLLLSLLEDWQVTRMMWECGITASVACPDSREWYLVRAGIPRVTPGPCDAMRNDPVLIEQALKKNPTFTLEELFENFLKKRAEPPRVEPSRLMSRRPWGSSVEAASWVQASALDAQTKAELLRFIARFPTLSFYREPPEFLDEVEAASQVRFPPWLRELRQTLAWMLPGEPERDVQVRFHHFDLPGHAASDPASHWYSIAPGVQSGESPPGFMSLGFSEDPLWSQLVIRKDAPKDTVIYDFAEEMFRDLQLEGVGTQGTLGPAFASYATMLAAIDAVRVRDGEPLLAVQDPNASA